MKEPTKKQLELLNVLNPHRLNACETEAEAAEELGIVEQAVWDRMMRLKKRCPEVYENFCNLRKMFNRDKKGLKDPIVMDPKDIEQLEKYDKIKEVF